MRTRSRATLTEERVASIEAHIPEDCYFIEPNRPERTAAQFLDWCGKQERKPRVLKREMMHAQIREFLGTATRYLTGPVDFGDGKASYILPYTPSTRDVNRVAQALRSAF